MAKKKPTGPDLSYIAEPLRHLAVPIDSLVLDPHNAKIHDSQSIDAIRGSLQNFGQNLSIVVQAEGRVVRSGNGRVTAARQLGWTHIAAIVIAGQTPTYWNAFAIADNRTAELSTWDNAKLVELLEDIGGQIESEEVAHMLEQLGEEVETKLAEIAQQQAAEAAAQPDPELVGKQKARGSSAYRVKITCEDAAQQLAILAECRKHGWSAESF